MGGFLWVVALLERVPSVVALQAFVYDDLVVTVVVAWVLL
jgi:hypothetical protein